MQSAAYFHSQSQNFRIKIGEDVTFPCHVNNRGNKDEDPQSFLEQMPDHCQLEIFQLKLVYVEQLLDLSPFKEIVLCSKLVQR